MHLERQQFWKNVLPSMAAFAFSGLYTIVDGFFIGQNIGDSGLAAINVAYPITALIQAIGTGLGMAGAIWIAISAGERDEEGRGHYLGNTLSLLLLASLAVMAALSAAYLPLLGMFGAEGEIFRYAAAYLKVIILGTAFQLCSVGLMPIIRNYNGALVAMAAMIAGFVTNIALDWYFTSVLKQGTAGAAWATIIGQGVALLPCLVFMAAKREQFRGAKFKLRLRYLKKICLTAVSPFGAAISPMLILIIINKAAFVYGGAVQVACYAVVSYVISVSYLLLQGIGDGVQPLIGKSYGANNVGQLSWLRKMAFFLSGGTAAFCVLALLLTRGVIPSFFGASAETAVMYRGVLPYFLCGLPVLAVSKVAVSYFYATDQGKIAYLLIYSEPIITAVTAGFLFSALWGINGVWAAVPVTQCLLAALSVRFLNRKKALA